jgi:hypothetical protein
VSRPAFLYEFVQGDNVVARRAASLLSIIAEGEEWTRSSLSHSEPEMTGEAEREAVAIKLPLSDPFALALLKNRYAGITGVRIFRYDRSDDSSELEWAGRIVYPEASGGTLTIRCEPSNTGLRQVTRPRVFMRPCPHTLYHGECRLDAANFVYFADLLTAEIDAGGMHVTFTPPADPFAQDLRGGILALDGEVRKIRDQDGDGSVYLEAPFLALIERAASSEPGYVSLWPGCNQTMVRCREFPNGDNVSGTNIENFGGFPWMISGGNNPFGGGSAL